MRSLLILALLCPLLSPCQQPALGVGDPVPAQVLSRYFPLNHSALPQARNKPLLLCFFASWCGTCLKELPKLVAAKKQYGDSLDVLLVTYEDSAEFATARQKNRWWASVDLPVVKADTVLRQYFPYKFVPHTVWISREGRVAAITGAEEMLATHIRSLVKGEPLVVPTKKDVLDFSPAKPLLQSNNGGSPEDLLFRSSFIRYLPGMGSSRGRTAEGKGVRHTYINHPVLSLYAAAHDLPPNRVRLEGLDTGKYYIPAPLTSRWKEENVYSYEVVVPATASRQKVQQIMLSDLNRYLGLYGRVEKRRLPCWVLVKTKKVGLQSRGGTPLFRVNIAEKRVVLQNEPLSRLVALLNPGQPARAPGPLVVDETGITGPVDLLLPASPTDLPGIKKALQPYGLDLLRQEREVAVFVLSPEEPENVPTPLKRRQL